MFTQHTNLRQISTHQTFTLSYLTTLFFWVAGFLTGPLWVILPAAFLSWISMETLLYAATKPRSRTRKPWVLDFELLTVGREIKLSVAVR